MCDENQIPCGPVAAIDEIFSNPQYAARDNILRFSDPRIGELAIPNVVPRLVGTPGEVNWLGPSLGEHNEEVYGDILGIDAEEMARLSRNGVI